MSFQREHELPEIAQLSLEKTILRVKSLFPLEDVVDLMQNLVEPPDMEQLAQSFARLREMGAIADEIEETDDGSIAEPGIMDAKVTFFGLLASHMPCDLVQSRVLMVGMACGILVESICVAASLTGSDVFSMPSNAFLDRKELETKLASSFAGRYCYLFGSLC
jgi:HrpA-like RNA helicase